MPAIASLHAKEHPAGLSFALLAALALLWAGSPSPGRASGAFTAGTAASKGQPLIPLPREAHRGGIGAAEVAGAASQSSSRPLASWIGLFVASTAACAFVVAKRTGGIVHRHAIGGFNQTSIIPSGKTQSEMTEQEKEEFLERRCAGLRKLIPQTSEDFEDEVDELTWSWGRYLLPYVDKRRQDVAAYKRRTILKQRDFFEKMRLFKPLVMKYPTLTRRLNTMHYPSIENRDLEIIPEWIDNEERIAGFTYEDFVRETKGNTFEDWKMPKEGELIPGIVVGLSAEGAFIEIGAKTWAFMPLANISLSPISTASEVLKMGQEIEAKIISAGVGSIVPGDPFATQVILSMTEIQRIRAWEEIDAIMKGVEGTSSVLKVMVKQMRQWGAIVQTGRGLSGIIPNAQLADKVGNTSIVGTEIPVEIVSCDRSLDTGAIPVRPSDFALVFSYRNAATKELALVLEVGQVVEAKVVGVKVTTLDVEVNRIMCTIRKMDISGVTRFEMADIFQVGETIKCYVAEVTQQTGAIKLSTRALERKAGLMLTDKQGVFDRAEDTAKLFYEKTVLEKQRATERLMENLDGIDSFGKSSGPLNLNNDDDLGF